MSHRMIALLCVCGLAGSTHAALFSFSPEVGRSTWVFTGAGDRITDARDIDSPMVLLVDDVDGPLPAIPFGVEFVADFTLSFLERHGPNGGVYGHTYRIDGVFAFLDLSGNTIMRTTLTDGLFTVDGSADTWEGPATIEAGPDYAGGTVRSHWLLDTIHSYDLDPVWYHGSDMEFTLTSMNSDGGEIALDPETRLPVSAWVSDAEYRGQNFVPGPAGAVIVGLGGLVALRRRR